MVPVVKKTLSYLAGPVLAIALAAGCTSGHSSGQAASAASSLAANPTVKADEQAAVKLVQGCLALAHVTDVKGCILGKVSKPERAALEKCLARDAASVVGQHDAKARFGQGAQACVAAALAGAGQVSPQASIPGYPATVTPAATAVATTGAGH